MKNSGVRKWLPRTQSEARGTRFVRVLRQGRFSFGILRGQRIHQIRGDLFEGYEEMGDLWGIPEVKLLCPCEPPKIFAVGRNYKSRIGDREPPQNPEIFYKPISALQHPSDPIVIPRGAQNVHFEEELVAVIGKKAKGFPSLKRQR